MTRISMQEYGWFQHLELECLGKLIRRLAWYGMQAVKIHDTLCQVIPKGRPILYLEIEVKIKKVAIFGEPNNIKYKAENFLFSTQ